MDLIAFLQRILIGGIFNALKSYVQLSVYEYNFSLLVGLHGFKHGTTLHENLNRRGKVILGLISSILISLLALGETVDYV